jgi:hypothetical protein
VPPNGATQLDNNVSPLSPTSKPLMRSNTLDSATTMVSPVSIAAGHQPNPSMSSIQAQLGQQDVNSTLRSGMGFDAYFNQSELARQPSDAYDPKMRRVNRASELSSISSGFGDGDIIVQASQPGADMPPMPQPPPQASQGLRSSTNLVGRYSWADRGNRDTVYTESSEDSPPRFRSVSSWVNQQTGRVKRAEEREAAVGDIPPVPGIPGTVGQNVMPPEPQYNMMMPDDEVPRRVEDTLASNPRR